MEKILEFLLYSKGPVTYAAAFGLLLACGIGLPMPEDITLFAMGLVSYYGLADVYASIAVCLSGVLLGDLMIYGFGRRYGAHLTKKGIFAKLFPAERLEKAKELFHRKGNKVIFVARFMPGLRAPVYFSAGTLKLPFRVFIFYDGLAAILSVPLLVGVAFYFGDQVDRVIRIARGVQNGIALLIFSIIALFVIKHFWSKRKQKNS